MVKRMKTYKQQEKDMDLKMFGCEMEGLSFLYLDIRYTYFFFLLLSNVKSSLTRLIIFKV